MIQSRFRGTPRNHSSISKRTQSPHRPQGVQRSWVQSGLIHRSIVGKLNERWNQIFPTAFDEFLLRVHSPKQIGIAECCHPCRRGRIPKKEG